MKDDKLRLVKIFNKNSKIEDNSTKCAILKDEDSFKDGDSVVVLDIDEYQKIKSKLSDFESKINDFKTELLDEKNKVIDSKEEIQELNNKINKIDNERVAIYKELDYKNKMILAYNVEINKSVFDAIEKVIEEAKNNINEQNLKIVNDINRAIDKTKIEVNERNKAIAFDINRTVDEINEEIKNTNVFKMMFYKDKINLKVPTNDLIKPFEFDFDINELISSKKLELDASEIIKNVMPKIPKPFSKYIESSEDNTIDIDKDNIFDFNKKED
jgi:tetrahydromethanopterin S-methyltransferase subunit G